MSCDGQSNPYWNCQSCRSGYFKWTTEDRCTDYCPSYSVNTAVSSWSFNSNTRGQYESSGNACANCDVKCNFCYGSAATNCFSCVQNYYLLDDQAECINRFSTSGYGP